MSDKNNDFIFAKSPKKLCFGAIFTIAGRFFQEETFPKDLGFLATGGGPKKKKKTLSSVVKDSA